MKSVYFKFLISAAALSICSSSFAGVLWNEAVNGDLTGNRFAPHQLTATIGSNTIAATTGIGDLEFYTIIIPTGMELFAIEHTEYISDDFQMFIGMVTGDQFTVDPSNPDVSLLYGYTLYGTGTLGQDILGEIATGPGAIGFTGPLGAGSYTLWAQQTGLSSVHTLDYKVQAVPEPGSIFAMTLGILALIKKKRAK